MKRRSDSHHHIILFTFLVLLLFILPGCSCRRDNEKGLIPEKTFEAILTEIHLADGLLMLPDVRNKYFTRDSIANYSDIAENHGYTKEAMDRTLRYYFTQKPKRLMKIYDHAIGRLTEIETILSGEPDEMPEQEGDLWKGASFYYLQERPPGEKIYFDHICFLKGEYTLTFSVTVYPSDETFNPCFTAWYTSADSADTGRRDYLPSLRYIKDGQPHTYTCIFYNSGNSPVILKGWLYDFENNPYGISGNAKIENISFYFTPRVL